MIEQAQALLEHLRAELHEPGLGYAQPPMPLTGGYDTRIFAFRLSGAPTPFAIPLILRVLGSRYPPARALSERATQNAVAGLGYPAPRVLLASPDPTILGGAFLVMERLEGRPLLGVRRLGVGSMLVEMQLRLHALDAEVLLRALDREGPPISREVVTLEGHLARLERRVTDGSLRGLEKAMIWLVDHRRTDGPARVICHGDFHPQNILMADDRVTGVIDWPNVMVADRAFDVASTRVILGLVPVGLMGVPRPCAVPSRSPDASSSSAMSWDTGAGNRWRPRDWPITRPRVHARVGPHGGGAARPRWELRAERARRLTVRRAAVRALRAHHGCHPGVPPRPELACELLPLRTCRQEVA